MKHLKITFFILLIGLVFQDVIALNEGTIQAARQQQAAAQLRLAQNTYLGGLGLPQNDVYRAALVANGGHGAAPKKEVLILQVLETGGAAGILHGNAAQQAAVTAILALPGADHTNVTGVAVQLRLAQNTYLGGLGLPQNDDYRAALVANGGHGAAPTIDVLILQVLETGGAIGILHGNAAQQAAVTAMLALNGVDHTIITREKILAAVELRALIAAPVLGHAPPFTMENIVIAERLIDPLVNLPVTLNNFNAVYYLENPQGGGNAAGVNRVNIIAAVSLLTALTPIPIHAKNVAAAIMLAPYALANQITEAQIEAVKGAGVNNAVQEAMVWAINTGFGNQPAGTVPAGIARVVMPDIVSKLLVFYGAIPFAATAGRFTGTENNEIEVNRDQLGGAAPAPNSVIVFTGAVDDARNPNHIILQNYAIAP